MEEDYPFLYPVSCGSYAWKDDGRGHGSLAKQRRPRALTVILMIKIRELPSSGYAGIKRMYQRSFLPLLSLAGPDSLQSWGNGFLLFSFHRESGCRSKWRKCRKLRVYDLNSEGFFFFSIQYLFLFFFFLSVFFLSIFSLFFSISYSYFFLTNIQVVFKLAKLTESRRNNSYMI